MSRARALIPPLIAAGVGISTGLYVFEPAFKGQREEEETQAKKAAEVAEKFKDDQLDTLINAEAAASRALATESALKPLEPANSWWPNFSLWAQGRNGTRQPRSDETSQKEAAEGTPGKKS